MERKIQYARGKRVVGVGESGVAALAIFHLSLSLARSLSLSLSLSLLHGRQVAQPPGRSP